MQPTTLERDAKPAQAKFRNPAARQRALQSKACQQPEPTARPRDTSLLHALTIIAHDLRGPLANLAVLLDLIETHAQMQAYDRMSRSTRRAQDLILTLDTTLQGFLQRTRETGDPLSFRPALVDLADVVRDAVRQNGPVAESRGVTLDCSGLRPLVISGDKRLLIEAVDNLLSNAIKYGPRDASVSCALAVSGRKAIISITDAGQGIAPEELRRGFQPFVTLSPSFSGRGSSWGLGLWIVRLIAERHCGFVDVVSAGMEPGTTFEIHLPFELI